MGALQVGCVHQHRCPHSQLCLVSRSGTKSALNLSETPGGREEAGQEEEEEVAAYTVSQVLYCTVLHCTVRYCTDLHGVPAQHQPGQHHHTLPAPRCGRGGLPGASLAT